MPKSITQLKKEIKIAEEENKRKKLEAKLKSLKSTGTQKKVRKGVVAALNRTSREFGF